MATPQSVFPDLTEDELDLIKSCAILKNFKQDDVIFQEGDDADFIYFVESGEVGISVQKFTTQEEVSTLGPGAYFGEMAVFAKNRRNATARAKTDTELSTVDKSDFLKLMESNPVLADRINQVLAARNEELILKESLVDTIGLKGKNLHVSIKGDPSLRESTFTRERYESPVDKILPQLSPVLESLMIERSVYQIFIAFNSGEIRTLGVFDPFFEEIHQASKLLDESYVDRHFARIGYEDKTQLIRRQYQAIRADANFEKQPLHLRNILSKYYESWQPISKEEISSTLSQLAKLRSIPDFYLRNFTISMTRDAIRMQFNCDGTHIVSAEDYVRFLKENI